jgi:hypothetical protein
MNFLKRWLHDDILKKIEGGHLLNANWRVQTLIRIDLEVCNAIQLVRSCPPTINKKHP